MTFLTFFQDIFFPKKCLGCHRLGSYICLDCQTKFIQIDRDICPYCYKANLYGLTHPLCRRIDSLDGLVSFFRYKAPLNKIIKQIKYRLVSTAMTDLVTIMPLSSLHQLKIYKKINCHMLFIPIPVHRQRQKQRGFNHVQLIAKEMNQYLKIDYDDNILIRIKNTRPQAQLKNNIDRYQNMRNAFSVIEKNRYKLQKKNIILFDDVWTSGFTLKAAAKVLKNAGASHIFGLTIAR